MTAQELFALGELWLLDYFRGSWIPSQATETIAPFYSCKTTDSRDLLILILPLYSMKPSFRNLFMKKFTRERVVPTMLARVSWETLGSMRSGCSCFP
jgi:hypothetical protein